MHMAFGEKGNEFLDGFCYVNSGESQVIVQLHYSLVVKTAIV